MALADQRVSELLEALASKSPTPGGGAIAALTGAMACGLAEMVLAYSMVKRLQPHHAEIEKARAELAAIRAEFVRAGDADAAAYQRFNDAMRIADRTPDQEEEYREALIAATEAPASVIALCLRVMHIIEALEDRWNANLASDLAMASILTSAAARSGWWNVRMNAPLLRDAEIGAELVERADADDSRVEAAGRRMRDFLRPHTQR